MNDAEREGGDITAADMIMPVTEPSKIQDFFQESGVVLITGATGFLGRLLVEKLLRCCSNVSRIYVLIRPKDGIGWEDRFGSYFDGPLYERVLREKPEVLVKVCAIPGDCTVPNLGLSEIHKELVLEEVNCVFHLAANANENLRDATLVNLRSTRDLIMIAKRMKELRSFVYVSNALLFSNNSYVEETFLEPPLTPENLLVLIDTVSDEKLQSITSSIIEGWPDANTFTKFLTENLLENESDGLPVVLVRASMIVATAKEPVAGWIRNFYGPTGLLAGVNLGLIRTLQCDVNLKADLIPADFVVNACLAAAWDVSCTKKLHENSEVRDENLQNVSIYNCASSLDNPVTWRRCLSLSKRFNQNIASPLEVWHHFFFPSSDPQVYAVLHFLLHILPAYVLDFFARMIGKNSSVLNSYQKLSKNLDYLAIYCNRQWLVYNTNLKDLWLKLNDEDKKHFDFDIKKLDWELYFQTFSRGSRIYLLRDPFDTIPEGEKKRLQLKIAHYTLIATLTLLLFKIFLFIIWLLFT